MTSNKPVNKLENEKMFIKLNAVIKIQNRYRYIRSSLSKINKKLIQLHTHLFNMVDKVQTNYELGIISKIDMIFY